MLVSTPGRIGNLEIKNRIVMAPMISNLANQDGSTNENHIAYLSARAAGGTGLIITEYTYVDIVNSRGSRNQLGAYSSALIPKMKRIPEAIHPFGAYVFMQLVHAGGKALRGENARQPMAPSAVDYLGSTPQEMSEDDIESVIRGYESASRNAKLAGFDGIEVHGAHGYLMHEFLSPTLNLRNDRYGGTFEKRLAVPQSVIDAVSQTTGLPVGIRLSLYEDDPQGFGPEHGLKVAESLRNLDYVHFSAGNFYPPGSSASFYSPTTHIVRRLPRKPNLTTMVVGSVLDIEGAERVLEKADFVSVGRAMLADPFFARKVISSPEILRPCIRCNQGCRDLAYGEVRCTVNPGTGHELQKQIRHRGEVVIAGGGVQGLEASLYASKAGLKVTLYEESDRLGGQLNLITDPAKKAAFAPLIRYYEKALEAAGVNIVLNEKGPSGGIECLPEVRYGPIPENCESIESNIFQHHDQMLEIAATKRLVVGTRSLGSLDRGRRLGFEEAARSRGIEFVEKGEFDFSMIVERQYDIGAAMAAGRAKVERYLMLESNQFL